MDRIPMPAAPLLHTLLRRIRAKGQWESVIEKRVSPTY
jgi:hypothetical protein